MFRKVALVLPLITLFVSTAGHSENLENQFIEAIKSDDQNVIDTLIVEGADLNYVTEHGRTPLLIAFKLANINTINKLVANGALIDAKLLAEKGGCVHCHSDNAAGMTPHIAGQHGPYIAKQLRDYHNKVRSHARMSGPSKALTEDIIVAFANYYDKLPRVGKRTSNKGDLLIEGENVYNKSCASCHGKDGMTTVNTDTPRLAGFNPIYTSRQLSYYREGSRTNDADGIMRSIASSLSDAEIQAVSEYIKILR